MISLLISAMLAQVPVPSVSLPPSTEPVVVFADNGSTYTIGLTSRKVVKITGGIAPPSPQPDNPSLTGFSKLAYESLVKSVPDAAKRTAGAKAMLSAISATEGQAGGLNLDTQQIVDELVANANSRKVPELLAGWNLAKLIADANVTSREQMLQVLADLKVALEACIR